MASWRRKNFEISQTKVLVCGLGGVGGICVDALYRSGFQNLTLIDADKFEITNQTAKFIVKI